MISKASRTFAELCKPHGRMQEVARELGAQQSLVSRWASGDRTPSAPWRVKIKARYGIDFPDWDEAAPEMPADGSAA